MTTVNPIDYDPTDYYALWDVYRTGGALPSVDAASTPSNSSVSKENTSNSAKGLSNVFAKDQMDYSWDYTYLMMTNIHYQMRSQKSKSLNNAGLVKHVSYCREQARLHPICL